MLTIEKSVTENDELIEAVEEELQRHSQHDDIHNSVEYPGGLLQFSACDWGDIPVRKTGVYNYEVWTMNWTATLISAIWVGKELIVKYEVSA